MRRYFERAAILAATVLAAIPAARAFDGSSWIFQPSVYSHSPATGERVAQFQAEEPAYIRFDPTYQESGYRQNHVGLQSGDSQDNLHIVQTWGQGDSIRPYGEWLYPFRAGATPYGPWGNPQGPWTLPFQSWQNPYGLGRYQQQPWGGMPGGPQGGPMNPQGPWNSGTSFQGPTGL